MEEVKNALDSMVTNKALGPDNIPVEFYQLVGTLLNGM
jgi:hypothetical protein